MKKRFIVAAVILVAVGIVIFGSAFIASGFVFSKPDIAQCETNTYTLSDNVETIEIQTDEANITFKPSEDGKVRVDCVEQEKVRHEVSVENGTLKIIAVDKRAWYDHLTLLSFTSQSTTVYLPSEHYQALTISTNTGDVSIPELFSFGGAEITASTGDVDFNASSDGNLKINTGTGHIHIRGISAGALDLFVSTGHVDVRSVVCAGAVEIAVSTGKATLTDVSCQSVRSAGSTGDVTGTLLSPKVFIAHQQAYRQFPELWVL